MSKKIGLAITLFRCGGPRSVGKSVELSEEDERGLNKFEMCIKKLDLLFLPRVSTIMEHYFLGKRL